MRRANQPFDIKKSTPLRLLRYASVEMTELECGSDPSTSLRMA